MPVPRLDIGRADGWAWDRRLFHLHRNHAGAGRRAGQRDRVGADDLREHDQTLARDTRVERRDTLAIG